MEYFTADGVAVTVGLRVFTQDWEWGTVVKVAAFPADRDESDAWHDVKLDSGRTSMYNRDRLVTRKPN